MATATALQVLTAQQSPAGMWLLRPNAQTKVQVGSVRTLRCHREQTATGQVLGTASSGTPQQPSAEVDSAEGRD